ncbi:phosphoenolpyruvate--protein phosphotransferase [Rhodococcus sp. IEGM 1408]|uniref:phosphoenolpyruvate--protein phosphotransferase n=1 Tax=Rhodococcus sp. IEGM 1408 TaxID=3082220 RepID=UPI002953A410|nr:putative PEP-binding protein [Rhodococcus sp. IEGM 1408]MDV7999950.1 putative PEP-binding protein [Rhodococcus sp. IEGM 1408]
MSQESQTGQVIRGTGVVAGLAYGAARWVGRTEQPDGTDSSDGPAVGAAPGTPPSEEQLERDRERFTAAAATVAGRLDQRASQSTGVSAEVLSANAVLVRDRGWAKAVVKELKKGLAVEAATVAATETFVAMFAKVGGRQAERITDLRDICARVVAELRGLPEPGIPEFDEPGVLLADDLAPADTAGLDPEKVLGIVTEHGGPTSHTAIIARQLGIPCVVAASGLTGARDGALVLVDGGAGTVTVDPHEGPASAAAAADKKLRTKAAGWSGPAVLADGHPVRLLANVQDAGSAEAAAAGPAGGIGLFRTELAFLDRPTEPTPDEQAELYARVLGAFPDARVVTRTLDAGSDKPLAFAGMTREDNPALGVRGIRVDLLDRGLVDRQLDALAEAGRRVGGAQSAPWVMAPMIATVDEARDFSHRCRERGLTPGIMVEVPSVAVTVDRFLPYVDFLSIGTNDLTQYVMAADRMSSDLAALTDPWQPAVLRLIRAVAEAASSAPDGRTVPVGVCGEAAADPNLACVLLGLGVSSLSAATAALPFVGAALAEVTLEECRGLAAAALDCDTAREARDAVLARRA